MLAIIVLMIIAITLGGLAAFQLYGITQNQNLLIQSQKNQSTLALWKSMIVSKAKAVGDNNEIVLPFGENTSSYHKVPSWVYFNTKNPWGKDIIYCPTTSNHTGTFNTAVTLSPSSSYGVRTVNNFATSNAKVNRDYVVATATNDFFDETVLAFLISPTPSSFGSLPNCDKIVYDANLSIYKVDNGLVEVITKGDVETYANLASIRDQNSGNGGFYSNTVEGEGSTSSNTFKNNLNYIIGQDVSKAYIKLSAGTHYIEDTVLNEFRTNNNDIPKVLIIEGETTNRNDTIIDTNLTSAKLTFNNYKVVFRNIRLSNKIINNFQDSTVTTENTQLYNLVLNNSKFDVKSETWLMGSKFVNNTMNTPEAHAINAYNSKIQIDTNQVLNLYEVSSSTVSDYAIRAENTEININGIMYVTKRNTSATDTIVLLNSKIIINSNPVNLLSGGLLKFVNTEGAVPYKSDILIDELSKVYLNNAGMIRLSGTSLYGIKNNGVLSSTGGSIITEFSNTVTNAAITLGLGSELYLDGSSKDGLYTSPIIIGNTTLANRPVIGIYDTGAKFIAGGNGSNVKVYAKTNTHNCFYKEIPVSVFSLSQTNNDQGLFSKNIDLANDSAIQLSNKSNWSCNI